MVLPSTPLLRLQTPAAHRCSLQVVLIGAALLGVLLRIRASRGPGADHVKEHYVAGAGLMHVTWFFTMAASLYSGYSVSGIVNESFNQGWTSTRWIPGGGFSHA